MVRVKVVEQTRGLAIIIANNLHGSLVLGARVGLGGIAYVICTGTVLASFTSNNVGSDALILFMNERNKLESVIMLNF